MITSRVARPVQQPSSIVPSQSSSIPLPQVSEDAGCKGKFIENSSTKMLLVNACVPD